MNFKTVDHALLDMDRDPKNRIINRFSMFSHSYFFVKIYNKAFVRAKYVNIGIKIFRILR